MEWKGDHRMTTLNGKPVPAWRAYLSRPKGGIDGQPKESWVLMDEAESLLTTLRTENEAMKHAHNGEICVDVQEYCDGLKVENERLRTIEKAAFDFFCAVDVDPKKSRAYRVLRDALSVAEPARKREG